MDKLFINGIEIKGVHDIKLTEKAQPEQAAELGLDGSCEFVVECEARLPVGVTNMVNLATMLTGSHEQN